MSKLMYLPIFCILFLLAVAHSTVAADSGPDESPISWWVAVDQQNHNYLQVTVKVNEGYCIKPDLKFYADYTDENGQTKRLEEVFHFEEKYKVCSKSATRYFALKQSAGKVQDGRMYWVKPRYRVHGVTKNS